jgi:hypothetical protein
MPFSSGKRAATHLEVSHQGALPQRIGTSPLQQSPWAWQTLGVYLEPGPMVGLQHCSLGGFFSSWLLPVPLGDISPTFWPHKNVVSLECLDWLMIIYSAGWGFRSPLAQINGHSLDIRQTSTVQLFVSSFYIHSPTQSRGWRYTWVSWALTEAGTAKECKEWFIDWRREGGESEGEREASEDQSCQNEMWFAAIFLSQCVFPGCLPSRAVQSLLLCVFMHKFRSSTKPWFLYSS